LAVPARAAEEDWLRLDGVGPLRWGATEALAGASPRSRELYLPDSAPLGNGPTAQPTDLELPAPAASKERRVVRVVGGRLSDAWLIREGPIDVSPYVSRGALRWSGAALGPGERGARAFGDATAWTVGDRSVLWWRDRITPREILVSRSIASIGAPGAGLPLMAPSSPSSPLSNDEDDALPSEPRLPDLLFKGDLKASLKPWRGPLSACLEGAATPAKVDVDLIFDAQGRPARIRAESDHPNLLPCFAAAVLDSRAAAGAYGTVTVIRLR
jgi:hypothetical protein